MDAQHKSAFLKQQGFLQDLPDDEIEQLSKNARVQAFEPDETIFLKGEKTTGMMAVVSGSVHIGSVSEDGKQLILNTIRAGEIFGEIGVLDEGSRTADAVAVEVTELLTIDRQSFLGVLRRNPDFSINLISVLCDRIRRTSEQAEDLALLDLGKRLAKKLVSLGANARKDSDAGGEIVIRMTQKDLGSMMGTSRESINKQLRVWEDEGLISLRRNEIVIHDEQRIQDLYGPYL